MGDGKKKERREKRGMKEGGRGQISDVKAKKKRGNHRQLEQKEE